MPLVSCPGALLNGNDYFKRTWYNRFLRVEDSGGYNLRGAADVLRI